MKLTAESALFERYLEKGANIAVFYEENGGKRTKSAWKDNPYLKGSEITAAMKELSHPLIGILPNSLNCLVVDIDISKDYAKEERELIGLSHKDALLKKLKDVGSPFFEYQTKSGGWHLWFYTNGTEKLTPPKEWELDDIKGDLCTDKMAILWGTPEDMLHNVRLFEKEYDLACHSEPVDARILDKMLKKARSVRQATELDTPTKLAYALETQAEGGRNNLLSIGVYKGLLYHGWDDEDVKLVRHAATHHGLTKSEVDRTIDSARKAVKRDRENELYELSEKIINDHMGTTYKIETGQWLSRRESVWDIKSPQLPDHVVWDIHHRVQENNTMKNTAQKFAMRTRLRTMAMEHLANQPEIDWDFDEDVVGLPNGKLLNLRTGKVFSDKFKYVRKTINAVPQGKSPLWERTVSEIFKGDKELIHYFGQVCAYGMSGNTDHDHIWLWQGGGGNGKSVLHNTLCRMMGDYADVIDPTNIQITKHQRHEAWMAELKGVRFAVAPEVSGSLNLPLVKMLSGGDKIHASHKGQPGFSFYPQFKLHLSSNEFPKLAVVDEAVKRRFRVLPFEQRFGNGLNSLPKDPNRERDLKKEFPGILAWILQYYGTWKDGFDEPSRVMGASEQYQADNDFVMKFMANSLKPKEGAKASRPEVGKEFQRAHPYATRKDTEKLYELLEDKYPIVTTKGVRQFKNVMLLIDLDFTAPEDF